MGPKRPIDRNSGFTYKGCPVDVKHAGVKISVFGTNARLRRAGGQFHITCQPIETATALKYVPRNMIVWILLTSGRVHVKGRCRHRAKIAPSGDLAVNRPEALDTYDLYQRALPHAQVAVPSDGEKHSTGFTGRCA
jgi:hypothetical protein